MAWMISRAVVPGFCLAWMLRSRFSDSAGNRETPRWKLGALASLGPLLILTLAWVPLSSLVVPTLPLIHRPAESAMLLLSLASMAWLTARPARLSKAENQKSPAAAPEASRFETEAARSTMLGLVLTG